MIVLSAYDNFHLVRTAFTLGALDYVRKEEMEGDSLLAVLKKAAAGIEKTQRRMPRSSSAGRWTSSGRRCCGTFWPSRMAGDSAAALASLGVTLAPPFVICAFWVGDFEDVAPATGTKALSASPP